jgi:pentatricopeptide repeat protein
MTTMVKQWTIIGSFGLWSLASGFLTSRAGNQQPKLQFNPPATRSPFPFDLKAASIADDELTETYYNDENQHSLVMDFVETILHETPRGKMKEDEVGLLREIMADFPNDIAELEPANTVESLLYRLLGEWKAALRDDDTEREEWFRPSSTDFSVSISAWENSADADKVVHVLSLLSDQRELFVDGHTAVQPDLLTIKSVLRSLAASRERGLDKRATVVFDSLGDCGLVADAEAYELMISITAKSRAKGAAERAEKLLREGVQQFPPQMIGGIVSGISTQAFNTVVTAYAKSGDERGPEKAEGLIVYMDQVDTENGSLGVCSPSINTFTSLIDAYAQRNEWEAANQADRILNQLLDQYMEGNDDLEPNIATWGIVINSWARLSKKNRTGAAERAGRLLKRMEDLYQAGRISCRPDAIVYVTCMNAYAFSKNGSGAAEAEQLLDEMNECYLDGDDSMKPSARSIKIVIDSWVKNGDMERAEDFLDKYEDFVASEQTPEFSEEIRDIYRSMLFGYTQQQNTSRARFYLEDMIEKGLKPDSVCFDRCV